MLGPLLQPVGEMVYKPLHQLGKVAVPRTISDGKDKGKNHVRFNTITKVIFRRSAGSTNNAGQTQVSQGLVENHQSLAVRCKQCLLIKLQTLAVRFSQWQEVALLLMAVRNSVGMGRKKEGSANNTTLILQQATTHPSTWIQTTMSQSRP